jgi:hypothetical protein
LRLTSVSAYSDSELLVRQLKGEYRVKNPDLALLFREVKDLVSQFPSFTISHVPRSDNQRADELCNEALDEAAKSSRGRKKPPNAVRTSSRHQDIEQSALTCLRSAAKNWARGDANDPKPEDVLKQISAILADKESTH